MTISLPEGWIIFGGGGTSELCAEVPPDNEIPSITIEAQDSEGGAIEAVLFCEPRQFRVAHRVIYLKALGGVPPFEWATGEGIIESTGPRTAKLSVMAGIEYFIPFWFGHYTVYVDPLHGTCAPSPGGIGDDGHRVLSACEGQVYLIGYDCSGEPLGPIQTLAGSPGEPPDFLFPTRNRFLPDTQASRENISGPNTTVDVIGNTSDRIATTSFGGDCMAVDDAGNDALWSLSNDGCCADFNGFNPISLMIECKTANKACYNEGIVDVGAPNFSDILNIPINNQNPPGSPVFEVIYGTPNNRIYVQTPAMLPGHEILVTATDYRGVTSLITVTT